MPSEKSVPINNVFECIKKRHPESIPYWDRDIAPYFGEIIDLIHHDLDIFFNNSPEYGGSDARIYFDLKEDKYRTCWFRMAYHSNRPAWRLERGFGKLLIWQNLPWIICEV